MRIELDDVNQRIFIDDEAVAALHSWVTTQDDATADQLTALDVIRDELLHPALQPVAEAMTEQFCHLTLTVAGAGGVGTHRIWAAPGILVAVAHLREDLSEVLLSAPQFVAAALARLTRLGVRPRLTGGPLRPDPDALTSLFTADSRARADAAGYLADQAPTAWAEWAEALRTDLWRAWRLDVDWLAPDGVETGRQLAVVDTQAGAVEVRWPAPNQPQLEPITPTDLWRAFVAILPGDDELPAA